MSFDLTVVTETERPIYVSRPWSGSRGQEYRVYRGRVELWSRTLVTMFVIPVPQIRSIRVVPPGFLKTLSGVLHGDQPALSILSVAIMDKAFSRSHVLIQRDRGLIRYYRFTPDDPEGFVAACERAGGQVRA